MQERLEGGWRRRDANSCSTEHRWSSVGKKEQLSSSMGEAIFSWCLKLFYSGWVRPILFNGSLVIRATIQASSARSNVASIHKTGAYIFSALQQVTNYNNGRIACKM